MLIAKITLICFNHDSINIKKSLQTFRSFQTLIFFSVINLKLKLKQISVLLAINILLGLIVLWTEFYIYCIYIGYIYIYIYIYINNVSVLHKRENDFAISKNLSKYKSENNFVKSLK